MPFFAVHCLDKPGHGAVRLDNRSRHLAWLESHRDRIVMAGPMLAGDGEGLVGSLLVVEHPDLGAVYAWCAEDPYAQAGLFESVVIRPYRIVFGTAAPSNGP